MKFNILAIYFEKIEKTSSRLKITEYLSELFNNLSLEEIEKASYLLQGRIAPLFERKEFGMAEKMVIKSAVLALGLDKKLFEKNYKKIGDIGKTVEYFKKQVQSFDEKDLSVLDVYSDLRKLAIAGGEGSQEIKINILANLIRQLDSLSARYLIRIPLGVIRLGFSDMTVLDSFSWMIKGDKSFKTVIEKAYHVCPDLGLIGRIIKERGIKGLQSIKPLVFTPIIMMRAERLSSGEEIIKQIGKCAIEPKYDGFRLQVHFKTINSKKEVRLYSRSLDDVSYMYPDICEGVKRELKANQAIIEGEAIGFNKTTGSFLPFQETVQRKRKYDIDRKAKEIPLKFFVFELLYLNGKSYLDNSFTKRRQALSKIIKTSGNINKDTLMLTPEDIIDRARKIELLFDDAVGKGLEGIIAKKLNGIYQPGARAWNWIKFKRSYSSKIEDTIDCLVMGYDYGKGKRTKFGIGAFLVGVYDKKSDSYLTIAKIGTGLTDNEWRELKKQTEELKCGKIPSAYSVDKQMNVDVWINPSLIVEIKADEITRSQTHTAGRIMKKTKTGKGLEVDIAGYALRFPRLESFRNDKTPEQATTLSELAKLYKRQR